MFRIVESKGGTGGSRDTKALEERLGAVVACANRNPLLIQHAAQILGVETRDLEGKGRHFFGVGAKEAKGWNV